MALYYYESSGSDWDVHPDVLVFYQGDEGHPVSRWESFPQRYNYWEFLDNPPRSSWDAESTDDEGGVEEEGLWTFHTHPPVDVVQDMYECLCTWEFGEFPLVEESEHCGVDDCWHGPSDGSDDARIIERLMESPPPSIRKMWYDSAMSDPSLSKDDEEAWWPH